MKEINTASIDKVIHDFFQARNIKCSVKLDTDFYYYPESVNIGYALVVSERTARLFPEFAKANGLRYETPIFILCLLHEVGHYYTEGWFDDDELCDFDEMKERLGDSDEDFINYFSIPNEFEATVWAINFINNNPDVVADLDRKLNAVFTEFCETYEIED